jgi:1-acyl-sn-glycerol-3-phosphate acyltransferase
MTDDPWRYDTAPDFGLPLVERLGRVPREPDMLVFGARFALAVALRAALRLGCRPAVSGAENLPRSGSFVLVANHASHLDAALLLSLLPLSRLHRAYPLAARDYFCANRARAVATALAFNVLPFDRDVPACRALKVCRSLLAEDGTVLVVFPEGTRSADGRVGPFKPGVGFLLAGLDVPVVPVHLSGTHRAWPKGARLPRVGVGVGVRVGRPRVYANLERTKASALAICEDLREAVLALSEGATHDSDLRPAGHDPHRDARGRHRDLLSRLAPARGGDARRRPVSPRT